MDFQTFLLMIDYSDSIDAERTLELAKIKDRYYVRSETPEERAIRNSFYDRIKVVSKDGLTKQQRKKMKKEKRYKKMFDGTNRFKKITDEEMKKIKPFALF